MFAIAKVVQCFKDPVHDDGADGLKKACLHKPETLLEHPSNRSDADCPESPPISAPNIGAVTPEQANLFLFHRRNVGQGRSYAYSRVWTDGTVLSTHEAR